MSVVVVLGTKGSPGSTTTSVLLAGCLADAVLVDGDLDGGVLAVRYGLSREPGLSTLAADRRDASDGLGDHGQSLGDLTVLVGPDHSGRAVALWERAGGRIMARLQGHPGIVVLDGGRLRPGRPLPVVGDCADAVVVVARSDSEGLVAVSNLPPELDAGLVVVDSGPHTPGEVAGAAGRPVVGVLPFERRTARVLNGDAVSWSRRAVARTPLGRAAHTLARSITVAASEKELAR